MKLPTYFLLALSTTAYLASASRPHLPRQTSFITTTTTTTTTSSSSTRPNCAAVTGAPSVNFGAFNLTTDVLSAVADLNLDELQAVSGVDIADVNLSDQAVVAEAILALLAGFFCLGINERGREQILGLGLEADVQLLLLLAQLAQLELLGLVDLRGGQGVVARSGVVGGGKGRGVDLDLFKREVNEITKTAKRVKERRDPKSLQRRQCQAFVGNDGVNLSSSEIEESVITAPPTSSETVSATSASTVAPTVSTEASEAPASDTPDVVRATAGLTQEELEDLGFL
ncbi:hypothetical protein VTJ04DRAFT_4794 [Mycothermus thermophilus]|uniref:uncharacterized protein n=1 Tax=Humicola insolens TaxID=85995 RepID=UPI003741EEF1